MKICLNCRYIFQSGCWLCPQCGWKPSIESGFISFIQTDDQQCQGFESAYFPVLFEIEKKHFWFKSRNRLIIWALKRFFPDARKFMEIGCGTGFVLMAIKNALPNLKVAGSELFSDGLAFANQRVSNSELYQIDAEKIPFYDEFDVLGAFDVLEHIADDRKVLAELNAALTQGGGLILTVPQHPGLWSRFDEKSRHVRRYTRTGLLKKISCSGFQTIFVSSFVTLLVPFMIADRWNVKADSKASETPEDAIIPAILNFFFELVMILELILIRIGISLPIGGSLIVVAIKK